MTSTMEMLSILHPKELSFYECSVEATQLTTDTCILPQCPS